MEKLQPLITHRFWVLFGLALILPLVSWALDNGDKAQQIEERTTAIRTDFGKATKGGKAPNQQWVTEAGKENTLNQAALDRAAGNLLENQQKGTTRFWPALMKPYVQDLKFGEERSDTAKSRGAFLIYSNEYESHFRRRVLSEISTYKDGKGLCDVAVSQIHKHSIGPTPTWPEIWHAQEDAWLVAQLLKSLNRVNEDAGAVTIGEAPIRQLHYLRLMGGNLDEKPSKSSTSGYPGGGNSSRGPSMGGGGSSAGGLADMGGADKKKPGGKDGSGVVSAPDIEFDEVEEFGSPAGKAKKSSGFGSRKRSSSSSSSSAGNGGSVLRRYVNDKEASPYKTRGFKLMLTIQQDSLPTVLAELTNSDWPVEIVRVHWEAANDFGREAVALGEGGGGLSGGGGGTPGGGFGGGSGTGSGFGNGGTFGSGGSSSGGDESADGGSYTGGGDESAYQDEGQQSSSSSSGSSYPGGGLAGGGRGPQNGGGGSSGASSEKDPPKDPREAALRDPYLANVVIAGLITIFRENETDGTSAAATPETKPVGATGEESPESSEESGAAPNTEENGDQSAAEDKNAAGGEAGEPSSPAAENGTDDEPADSGTTEESSDEQTEPSEQKPAGDPSAGESAQ